MEIVQQLISPSRRNRPGTKRVIKGITIHDTDNTGKGADALAHAKYMGSNPEAITRQVSWHYTVDDKRAVQSLPDDEIGWHTSTSKGNRDTIGIEICVNSDGNQAKADDNAARLTAHLLKKYGLALGTVVQHNRWSGKNCPRHLRATTTGWSEFLRKVSAYMSEQTVEDNKKNENKVADWAVEAQAALVKAGITDGARPNDPITRQEVWVMLHRAGVGK